MNSKDKGFIFGCTVLIVVAMQNIYNPTILNGVGFIALLIAGFMSTFFSNKTEDK